MDFTYDFAALQAESERRELLLKHFDRFRAAFLAQMRHFLAAAKVEGIYGVSDLDKWEHEDSYKFSFNGRDYIFIANETVLRLDPLAEILAARIVFYYDALYAPQPPLLDITFQEHEQGRYAFVIDRNLKDGWQQIGQDIVKSDEAGAVAAIEIAQQIINSRAGWLKDVPPEALAAGDRESGEPLGYRINR